MNTLEQRLSQQILFTDGAIGTHFQSLKLTEEDWRKGPFVDSKVALQGNFDLFFCKRYSIDFPHAPCALQCQWVMPRI